MMCALLVKPLLRKTNSSPYVLFVPSCVIWATMKNPFFGGGSILCWRSLTATSVGSWSDIVSQKWEKTCPACLDLNWHHSAESHQRAVKAFPGVCICMRTATLSLFASYGSVFLTCVAPLQNKQRWGEKTAPNSLSTHSFPPTLHENRWLWHYQQSQLVSHACSGGDRMRSTAPFHPRLCSDTGSLFSPSHSSLALL